MSIKKMRTIVECAKLIKELDPQTGITEFFIRCLVKDNKVNHVMVNTKALVDFDNLLEFFNLNHCEVSNV